MRMRIEKTFLGFLIFFFIGMLLNSQLTTKPDLPLEVAVPKSRFLKINLKVKKTQIRVRRRVELEGTNDLPACAASWRGT